MAKRVSWLCSGSIVVEHLTLNPRVGSPNPATSTERQKSFNVVLVTQW
jgi:hypothetical protein